MKRTSILVGGVFLTIFYALAFVASLGIATTAVIYFFVNKDIEIINAILLPILNPFMSYGQVVMLVSIGAILFVSLFMLIASSKFIKHSYSNVDVYNKKRKMLITFVIFAIVLLIAYIVLFILGLVLYKPFNQNILSNGILIFAMIMHIAGIISVCVGLGKNDATVAYVSNKEETQPSTEEEKDDDKKVKPVSNPSIEKQEAIVKPVIPPIYTDGLDPDEQPLEDENEEIKNRLQNPQEQAKGYESASTKKLIEGINKLDQMRKEGSITTVEYTKLRSKMIRKFVK